MNSFNKRIYEMLVRVLVFATTYPQLFSKASATGQLIEQIDAAVAKLSTQGASQASGKSSVRTSSGKRANARSALRSQLEAISRTARGVNLSQFWIPGEKSDRALVEIGKMFASHAEPLKQVFIDSHLPGDFIEKLNAAVQDLENTIKDQVFSKGSRLAATAAIEQTRTDALSALKRLDPLMENLLRDDPPTRAVWESARHVEQIASVRPVVDIDAPAVQA